MNRPSEVCDLAEAPLRYVVACQPVHDRLREAATQLGGLSLMTMLRRDGGFDLETPLRMASETVAEAGEALGGLAVPDAAAHHFHHMTAAARALNGVVGRMGAGGAARASDAARREISAALRAAADHLRFAANAMPGFETVDLKHACCAAHAAAVLAAEPVELKF
ncbi:MAG: hypothetical protein KDK07_15010 [Bauldia sp.]|nr:hypothetical protein [Bauldia sp.]